MKLKYISLLTILIISVALINTINESKEHVIELQNTIINNNLIINSLNESNISQTNDILYYESNLTEQKRLTRFYIDEAIYYSRLDNKLALNPRWSDVEKFIKKNTIDENVWDDFSYDCTSFSNDLIKEAIKNNIFMCTVEINWIDGAHVIVAVNTSDKGIVYIEPQTDTVINLTLGKGGHKEFINETVISYESCFERIPL